MYDRIERANELELKSLELEDKIVNLISDIIHERSVKPIRDHEAVVFRSRNNTALRVNKREITAIALREQVMLVCTPLESGDLYAKALGYLLEVEASDKVREFHQRNRVLSAVINSF